jgi:nitrous oxidase accessory protein
MRNYSVPSARIRGRFSIAATILALCVSTVSAGVASEVHEVGEGQSIAEALARCAPGDTVRIAAGVHHENLVVTVPVVLTGPVSSTASAYQVTGPAADPSSAARPTATATPTLDLRPTIRGGYQGNVLHVLAPGTVVEGLHISEAGPHLTKDMACILIEADSVTVRDCLVTESLHGIYVKGGNGTVLENNRVEGRLDLIEADRGNGIHLWNSNGNRVSGNEILNARDGIYFSFANETSVTGNHIHHVRYGLHYMYSNSNTFTDNLFELNVAGAALMYSKEIIFTRNAFARCRGFRAYGILFQSVSEVTARENLVLDNSRGIFMTNTVNSLLESNDVVDNDLALQLNGGCEGVAFLRNNFINNLSELLLDVSDRETRWSDTAGGNHWSRYSGYDLDRDGIGDVPFDIQNVFQIMESQVPEVRFYLLSPAAKILELAEQALPILGSGDARDPRPLVAAAPNPGVPWDSAGGLRLEGNRLVAGCFLFGAVLPFVGLMHLSRRTGRQRR